jgi:biopolymer transport protein ExbB
MKLSVRILALLIGAAMFVLPTLAIAQDAAHGAAPAAAEGGHAAGHKKNLWEQIKEGGWVMVPIGFCSVLTLYFIVDGVMRTGRKRVLPDAHVDGIKNLFRQGDYVEAYNFAKSNPSAFSNVARVMISQLGEGKNAVDEGMQAELAKENSKMQTYISYLSVIGVCTPMIGLLGTTTGMIGAFGVLGSSGIGDPSALSAKIGEVLTATAAGLFIAIPAFTGFYYLRNRAVKAIHDIEDTMNLLFRKMPYDLLAGVNIGDEELYAADPNWTQAESAESDASGAYRPVTSA